MTRLQVGAFRVLAAAFAAWGAIACNSLLGIEEPPQAPASDAAADGDGETNGDAGVPDISISDAPIEDAPTMDGSNADAPAVDAPPESGSVDDAPPDGPGDAGDAPDGANPVDGSEGDTGGRDGSADVVRIDGDAGRVDGDVRTDAPAPRPDTPRPDGSLPPEIALVLTITKDQDDATWINNTDERLHYDTDSFYLEVGADTEAGKAGLRFELPVPAGSIINSAFIELHRTIGDALPDESMKVQVYDSSNVPPFDDAHTHAPEGHAAGGLWPTAVGPIWVGENGKAVQTSDLRSLVQHIVDRPDWVAGGAIGFVFSAQVMGVRWVDFADFSLGVGQASLRIVYTPP
ncbi:MAG TPA: hypothetical protein VK540_10855 [Polyangiaceae bacterium]|nr:hypothetical protein [Polyangiaceae bacterium]